MSANPLLEKSTLPNQAPPFDRIRTEHYLPGLKAAIEEAERNIKKIKNNKAEPDFENTLVALECASETLDQVSSAFYNQLSAVGGDDLHALAAEMGPLGAKFSNDVLLDAKLFKRVKAVYDKRESLKLTPEQKTLLEDTYKGFVRGGAGLSKKKKTRLREISERLSTLSPAFMQNTVKSAEAFELIIDNQKDLSGLPESAIESASHAAEEKGYKGKWLFTLDYPSFGPFLQYADNRALREKIWRANASRAWKDQYDNCANILETVKLKKERAKLLGYKTHAHYVLEERMAKSPEEVMNFLKTLKKAYKPAAKKDLAKLKKYAAKEHGLDELMPWDVGYYAEKLRKKLFDFTSEDFRPYLSLEKVLAGCFDHFSKLFGIKFEKADGKYPVWHKDVQVFDVVNKGDGAFVGTFYADFHPRTGKNQGAWMTTYRNQGLWRGRVERPLIAIVSRLMRASMIEALRSNAIRTARAKGLPEMQVILRHALPIAMLPVVSYVGPALAGVMAGSFVIETVYQLPGIGKQFVYAAQQRDYTLVMGVVLIYSFLIILFNLAADVMYRVLDPRARTP